jgi:hypothetical protein
MGSAAMFTSHKLIGIIQAEVTALRNGKEFFDEKSNRSYRLFTRQELEDRRASPSTSSQEKTRLDIALQQD